MNEFFIRFNLQDMVFSFQTEDFYNEKKMQASKEDVDKFIEECKNWQKEKADILKKEIDLSPLHGKRILYIGDSITAERTSYRGITTYAADFEATNGAISGATSVDMLRFLKENIKKSDAEIISIMIGTNDSGLITGGLSIVSPDEYRRNIREILRISKEKTDKVMISTLPPLNEEIICKTNNLLFDGRFQKMKDVMSEIVREESERAGVLLNDVALHMKDMDKGVILEEDGTHLTKEGQFIYARNWLLNILKLYK
ncbi:MAG: hypothetical protein E7394_00350 [Ruminococcaceae bacterium]|nr:hypothetical protein [Oscillospiraceae bacterium]